MSAYILAVALSHRAFSLSGIILAGPVIHPARISVRLTSDLRRWLANPPEYRSVEPGTILSVASLNEPDPLGGEPWCTRSTDGQTKLVRRK